MLEFGLGWDGPMGLLAKLRIEKKKKTSLFLLGVENTANRALHIRERLTTITWNRNLHKFTLFPTKS